MPKRKTKAAAVAIEAPRAGIGGYITSHPREFVGMLLGGTATVIIFVNALVMQKGPHPAPIFAARPAQIAVPAAQPVPVPQPRAPVAQPQAQPVVAAPQLNRVQTIAEIQRELTRRGYYDGTADGIWGAKTDSSARNFGQATGIRVDANAPEEFLKAITAPAAAAPAPQVQAPAATPATRRDPIADLIGGGNSNAASSPRMVAIQRALSDFGYGQIKPTGSLDAATKTAIEKFERDRKLPVTGQVSDRFVRELSAMTGRPLE